jgi:hypothetical protein
VSLRTRGNEISQGVSLNLKSRRNYEAVPPLRLDFHAFSQLFGMKADPLWGISFPLPREERWLTLDTNRVVLAEGGRPVALGVLTPALAFKTTKPASLPKIKASRKELNLVTEIFKKCSYGKMGIMSSISQGHRGRYLIVKEG